MFEKASRKKYRYPSANGLLSTEQLWDLPLKGKLSLNAVAVAISKEIREEENESFVDEATPSQTDNNVRLDIVKFVIKDKLDKISAAEKRKAKKVLRDKIAGSLQESEDRELLSKSPDELRKMLKALEDAED